VASERVRGALMVGRRVGRRPFSDADLDIATTFANHAAVALELADGRQQEQRMALLEDRDRIARDLHDHVIQRLFAAGLTVQSVASALGGAGPSGRLDRVVNDIDDTIRQIRTSIFQLRGAIGPQGTPVRRRLLAVADDVAATLGFQPQVQFSGPVDTVVSAELLDDVLAVVREALTNTARHAEAGEALVRVRAGDTDFTVTVADNGRGLSDAQRRSGLANLQARATRRGGRLELSVPPSGGTELTWSVPLT
jgi:signal transduction histidine kinase